MKVKRKTRTRKTTRRTNRKTTRRTTKSKVRSKVSRRSTKRKTYKRRKNRKTTKIRNRKLRGGATKKDADPTPGPFRVVSEDGVLARVGVETSSDTVTKLDWGVEIKVVQVIRRADGVVRLCFTKAGLEKAVGGLTDATQQLWVNERKDDDQSLLLKKIEVVNVYATMPSGRHVLGHLGHGVEVEPTVATILQLKRDIVSRNKILKVGEINLKFKGKELSDGKTLDFYDIKDETTLHVEKDLVGHEMTTFESRGGLDGKTTITVMVEEKDDNAGFVADDDMIVTKIFDFNSNGVYTPCSNAGVKVGMHAHSFQGEVLKVGDRSLTTWKTLKEKVKKEEKPWTFIFSTRTIRG